MYIMTTNIYLPAYILKPLAVLAAAGITSIAVVSFKAGAAIGRKHPNAPKEVTSLLAVAVTDKITEQAVKAVKKGSVKVNKHVASIATAVIAKRTGLPKDVIAKIPSLIEDIGVRFAQKKESLSPKNTDTGERTLHMSDLLSVSVEDLQKSDTPVVIDSDLLAKEADDYITKNAEEALEGAFNVVEDKASLLEEELLEDKFTSSSATVPDDVIYEEIIDEILEQEVKTSGEPAVEDVPENVDNTSKKQDNITDPLKALNDTEFVNRIKERIAASVTPENIDSITNLVNKNQDKIVGFFKDVKNKK